LELHTVWSLRYIQWTVISRC